VGRLAGFEVDPRTRLVRKIIFSSDGELGNHVLMRPFASVLAEPGEIDIRPYAPVEDAAAADHVLVGQTARIIHGDREMGRVTGLDVAIGSGELEGVLGRRSWWTRRFHVAGTSADLSVPGEVRMHGTTTQAA
jgi:hypothetical protein